MEVEERMREDVIDSYEKMSDINREKKEDGLRESIADFGHQQHRNK